MFRGVKLTAANADQFEEGSTTNLLGYTSTSKDMSTAINFAFKFIKED